MSKSDNLRGIGRRSFLKGAALASTAAVTVTPAAEAAVPVAKLKAPGPGPRQIAVETQPPVKDPATQSSSGGDFMADVFKALEIE